MDVVGCENNETEMANAKQTSLAHCKEMPPQAHIHLPTQMSAIS